MRTIIAATVLAAILGMAAAPRADAFVSLDVRTNAVPGKFVTVTARPTSFLRPRARYTCRLTARAARGEPKLRGLGKRRGRGRLLWRLKVAPDADPGKSYRLRVRCPGAGSDTTRMSLTPSRAKVLVGTQHIAADGEWAVQIRNRSGRFEARNLQLQVNVLDASGGVIDTETEYVSWLPAGGVEWLTGSVEAERPARIAVRGVRGERWPRSASALQVGNVRIVDEPPSFDGDTPDRYARATLTNPNGKSVSATATILAFGPDGSFLGWDLDFAPDIPGRGEAGVSAWLFGPEEGAARILVAASGNLPGG